MKILRRFSIKDKTKHKQMSTAKNLQLQEYISIKKSNLLLVPPRFPAIFSFHTNSTFIKKPTSPIIEILHSPIYQTIRSQEPQDNYKSSKSQKLCGAYFCHSKPEGLNIYGAKSHEMTRNQLLSVSKAKETAPPSVYPYAMYTIKSNATSSLRIKVENVKIQAVAHITQKAINLNNHSFLLL